MFIFNHFFLQPRLNLLPKQVGVVLIAFLSIHFAMAQEFVNPLFVPPLISSSTTDYHLNVVETEHDFSPMGTDSLHNVMIKTFAFEDANNPGTTTILGPSLAWQFGNMLTPQVTNMLSERTTCHWHGAHVPQAADGGPHQIIEPGATWSPQFEVKDKSATMWYHPHAMGLTYKHVQMGLSGMIYVEDPVGVDPILSAIHRFTPHNYNVDDFPLVIQTKKFRRNAQGEIEIQAEQGYKNDYTYLVNGRVDPVLEVPANMIRLRVLNGDGKFSFMLGMNNLEGTQSFPLNLIATDAGYTTRTHEMDQILMAPGERTEWLLDLRGLAGTTLYLYNKASAIPDGVIGNRSTTGNYATDRPLMALRIVENTLPPSPIIDFPLNMHPSEMPPLSEVTNTRHKVFRRDNFMVDGRVDSLFNIDSTLMNMMVVNDVVKLDSTEIWTIENRTTIAHPWHIHDIHFWVTEIIQNSTGEALNPANYPEIFGGPKDNVMIQPDWTLSYIATFADYGTEIRFDSSYMYHCHILPHEDKGMMGQFVVWNGEGDGPTNISNLEEREQPMKLFPNPSSGALYLEGSSEEYSVIYISDVQGRLIRALKLPPFAGVMNLNVEGLPAGLLVLDWRTAEGRAVERVVLR